MIRTNYLPYRDRFCSNHPNVLLSATLSEFAVEQRRVRITDPGSGVQDGIESAAIRLSSEIGKFLGPLGRGNLSHLFMRFDFMCTGEAIGFERMFSRSKFALFSVPVPVAYWLGIALG